MKLPRFHLATILLACATLSLCLGANLCIRTMEYVEFLPTSKLQEPDSLTQSSLYAGHYRSTDSWIGWPATLSKLPGMTAMVDVFDREPISTAEKHEIKILARAHAFEESDFYSKWDAAEFRRLAPLIYRNIAVLSDAEKMPPNFPPQFLNATDLLHSTISLPALALNTAVALAITIALAAACELLLRHKKRTPPVG